MDDMRELVTVEQATRLFVLVAIVLPILGAAVGAWLGSRRGRPRRGLALGLLAGMAGPGNLALWRMYNGITDRLGLDTVRNLLTNLAIFAAIGVALGVAVGFVARRMGLNGQSGRSPGA
ncbi:MAG: hypothetical protein NT029_05945 [Armatimonadetes bacterium]|nr:hypothetical protein [Armatimonadota bacterium]